MSIVREIVWSSFLMLGRIDADLALYNGDFPAFDRLRSRGTRRSTAGNMKPPLMEGTFDFFTYDVAFRQKSRAVGAFVLRHVKGAIDIVNGVCAASRFGTKRASRGHFGRIAERD
jgi:hypothetical protein